MFMSRPDGIQTASVVNTAREVIECLVLPTSVENYYRLQLARFNTVVDSCRSYAILLVAS